MSTTLRVTLGETAGTAAAIEAAALAGPMVVLTERTYRVLTAELGDHAAAMGFLLRVSEEADKPIGVNFPTPEGSRTCFLAPRGWTQDRLRGWIGARHEEIAEVFGPGVPLPLEDV